jgi:cytochrome P450
VIDLAAQFERDMLADSREYTKLTKTSPSRYLQMIQSHGAVETARRLACDPSFHEGFTRAWEHHCLNLTAEYLIAYAGNGQYRQLFSDEAVEAARKKLKAVGVDGSI